METSASGRAFADEPYSCLAVSPYSSGSVQDSMSVLDIKPRRESSSLLLWRCDMNCSEEARKAQGGDKEAAIRFRLSAGHACVDFHHVNRIDASMWFDDVVRAARGFVISGLRVLE